jgi:hypothetical protein
MIDDRTLQDIAASPAAFREHILIPTDAGPQPFASTIDDWQRADFEATDGGWSRVVGLDSRGKNRAWIERPRGHSKSSDAAVQVSWALVASCDAISGVLAAGDEDQAGLVKDAVAGLCRLNPWLAEFLKIERSRILNSHTGSECRVITSDAMTSYGLTPHFIVADEVTHWAKPDLFWSLISAAGKRASCMLLSIMNAGWQETWQYEFRQKVVADPDFYFSSLEGPRASWIPQATYEQQRRLLPSIEFDRQWGNRWGVGSGLAFDAHVVDAAFAAGTPMMLKPEAGWEFAAGVDLSSSRDFSSVAIVGRKDLRFRLCRWQQWVPSPGQKIDQRPIEQFLLDMHKLYRLKKVVADAWQAEGLCTRLRAAGVPIEAVQQSGARLVEQATQFCSVLNSNNIDLPADDQLERQIRRVKIEAKSYGVRLAMDRTTADGHFDLLSSVTIALAAAKAFRGTMTTGMLPPAVFDPTFTASKRFCGLQQRLRDLGPAEWRLPPPAESEPNSSPPPIPHQSLFR